MSDSDYITCHVEFNRHHKRVVSVDDIKAVISPHGKGVLFTPDNHGCAIAERVAREERQHAIKSDFKPTNGQPMAACAEDHRIAAYGELATACVTGLVWHDFGGGAGPDVGDHIDVKSVLAGRQYLIVTPKVPEDCVLVLATVDMQDQPTVFIQGWMIAAEARRVGKLRKYVTSRAGGLNPTVHESELHPMCDLPGGNEIWLFSTPPEYLIEKSEQQQPQDGRLQF